MTSLVGRFPRLLPFQGRGQGFESPPGYRCDVSGHRGHLSHEMLAIIRKQCVELSAPLPPTTNRSWDVARHVLSRRHGSREGGCQVSENLGDMAEGIGAESIDGLLCNLAPGRLQLRQKCPAPAAELDDRGATVSW